MASESTIGTTSTFSSSDGRKVFVLIAPDDANAPHDRRNGGRCWGAVVKEEGQDNTHVPPRGVSSLSSADYLLDFCVGILLGSISTSEVNERTAEVEAWIEQVHEAYWLRVRALQPGMGMQDSGAV